MKYVVVMPFVHQPYADACLSKCRLSNVLAVDNTVTNRGIMRSHNLGVDFMRQQDADWLILLSAAIRFGEPGGLDFVAELEANADLDSLTARGVYGWHFIAFSRAAVEAAGRWDESFHPYGWDDVDYAIRVHNARKRSVWANVAVDVSDAGMGHSIKLGGVTVDNEHHLAYLKDKWGAPVGSLFGEFHKTPFNDPDNPMGYWPTSEWTHGGVWDQPAPEPIPEPVR